jgi:undecaprenyl pyrophosphate synthase
MFVESLTPGPGIREQDQILSQHCNALRQARRKLSRRAKARRRSVIAGYVFMILRPSMSLTIAVAYGGRQEIIDAAQ